MLTMPESLQIGALTFTVEHSHESVNSYQKTAGADVFGVCILREMKIIVGEGYPLSSMQKTLCHEALHALSYAYDLDDCKIGDEHSIRLLTTGLLLLLRNNPELVAYLLGEEG